MNPPHEFLVNQCFSQTFQWLFCERWPCKAKLPLQIKGFSFVSLSSKELPRFRKMTWITSRLLGKTGEKKFENLGIFLRFYGLKKQSCDRRECLGFRVYRVWGFVCVCACVCVCVRARSRSICMYLDVSIEIYLSWSIYQYLSILIYLFWSIYLIYLSWCIYHRLTLSLGFRV